MKRLIFILTIFGCLLTSCVKNIKTASRFLANSNKLVKVEKHYKRMNVKRFRRYSEDQKDVVLNIQIDDNSNNDNSGW
jgi:hypothetical protein